MATQSSNIFLVLANAVANFNGTIAECQQNADFLLSDLAGVSISDLQVLGFGKLQSEAFLLSLKSLVEFVGKRHTAQTKAFINHIFSLLLDASNKQAATEKAAHNAEIAAIAQHPAIAPVVAACAKSRELIIELADCNEARFFEICNEVEQIGNSNEILPYALQASETKAAFGNYEAYINFTVSPFYDRQIDWHITNALKVAADRLNLFLMYNGNGEFMNTECDETQGYYAFRVMNNVIGWVLDEPTNEPALIDNTNGLFVQTANGEWAHVQDAEDEAGLDVADYLDLYSDAGWELDFEPMQIEQVQDIYAAAKERDGDDDDKNSADQLVEKFAKFIHAKLQERHSLFLHKIESIGFQTTAFCYEILLHEQTKISLRVEENGNCHLKHLCAGVGNGSVCSISFCAYLSQYFEKFFCSKMESFFRDILQNNL